MHIFLVRRCTVSHQNYYVYNSETRVHPSHHSSSLPAIRTQKEVQITGSPMTGLFILGQLFQ